MRSHRSTAFWPTVLGLLSSLEAMRHCVGLKHLAFHVRAFEQKMLARSYILIGSVAENAGVSGSPLNMIERLGR